MHRPRASLILKIVPNAKVYTEHSADLHVAPEKPSLLVPIRTLIFSVWRVGNIDLRGQNSLALRSWLFIFLFNCTSFYLQFLLSEPRESFFSSELDLYLFSCKQTPPAIHLKLSSHLSTQHQSRLGCACVFRGGGRGWIHHFINITAIQMPMQWIITCIRRMLGDFCLAFELQIEHLCSCSGSQCSRTGQLFLLAAAEESKF